MTSQMGPVSGSVSTFTIELARVAPPSAPLAMPKQVLTRDSGQLLRALGQWGLRFLPERHSVRRTS